MLMFPLSCEQQNVKKKKEQAAGLQMLILKLHTNAIVSATYKKKQM